MTSGLKGLKKEGTPGEGRQGKIGDDSMRSYYHEIMEMEILPQYLSLKVGAYEATAQQRTLVALIHALMKRQTLA